MKVLIDGDSIVYANAFAVEKETSSDVLWMLHYNLDKKINSIINNTQASSKEIYLSGKDNFRDKIATISPYKGSRKTKAKPIYYKQARDYLIKTYKATVVDGMEAEDMVSIKQYEYLNEGYGTPTCMAHIDKDLNNSAGYHYDFNKQISYELSHNEANKNYWRQVLVGDWYCDGIPGLKGMGNKTADKWLGNITDWEELKDCVRNTYESHASFDGEYSTELQGKITHKHSGVYDVFNEISQLIYILREPLNGNSIRTQSTKDS